jgi:hypothetical protein
VSAVWLSMLVLRCGRAVLMVPTDRICRLENAPWGDPVRGDLNGLYAGMWQLPSSWWFADSTAAAGGKVPSPPPDLLDVWCAWLDGRAPGEVTGLRHLGVMRHAVTRYRLRVWVVGGTVRRRGDGGLPGSRWLDPLQAQPLPIAALSRKALACG